MREGAEGVAGGRELREWRGGELGWGGFGVEVGGRCGDGRGLVMVVGLLVGWAVGVSFSALVVGFGGRGLRGGGVGTRVDREVW